MNHSNKLLNDIVAIARDGKSFYEHAATKVNDPELKSLFIRIAAIKDEIVTDLSSAIKTVGDTPAESGTLVGEISKMYGDLRSHLGDKNYAFVAQLENSEDRLLRAFDEARSDKDISATALAALTRLAPEVRQCHDIMSKRKHALKKAA
jgi:uncharacterized protein (TIGR02284 family)